MKIQAFELTLAARPESLPIVRRTLDMLEDCWAADPAQLDDARIAVSEACANVVMHAYPGRKDGIMVVVGEVDGPRLCIRVRDHGGGIKPRTDSPGLGLGLPLILALSQDLELSGSPDDANEVRMTFLGRQHAAAA